MGSRSKVLSLVLVLALALGLAMMAGCQPKEETKTEPTEEKVEFKTIEEGKLIVGSDLDYPPFESLKGDVPEGFDIDIVTALARELGVEAEFKKEIFDTLIPTLKAGGKFDMVASAMTIKPERQLEIDFTEPYFDSNQSIAMKKGGTYSAPADLKGKKVGVQSGTTGEAWANENLKPAGAEIVTFKGTSDAFAALQAGNVAAVVNDLPVSAELVKDETRGLEVVAQVPTGEQYGFGVSKDNPGLRAALNDALAKIKASGEYDEIYEKWFGDVPR